MSQLQSHYAPLAQRLHSARGAYKRVNALAGGIVFVIEALGILALVILADLLFDLALAGRIALFAAGAIALAYLAYRHIIRPLGQSITDQQLALYLEERNPEFEGSLIAATEFGQSSSLTGRQAEIVDSILDNAIARTRKFDLKKAVDPTRLRKYAVVAGVLVVVYALAAVIAPQSLSKRFARVLAPWKPVPKEEVLEAGKPAALPPIELKLSAGDTALVRGGTLNLEAELSRTPNEKVSFHFRSTGSPDSAWKIISMSEIEKVHTFAVTLPDINEDLEFFVSAESTKSDPKKVSVYDPLLIRSYEITTKFPAYLGFPDRVDRADAPDISAIEGSTVTVRASANGTLATAKLMLDGQPAQAMQIDSATPTMASGSFDVKANTSLTIQVSDKHNQTVQTPTAASVTAISDVAPVVKLNIPLGTVTTNPLGEILFDASATDDLALDSAELVVQRGVDPNAKPIRIRLPLDPPAVTGSGLTSAQALGYLQLETLSPLPVPGDVISCYIEVKDKKGQATPSDLVQIAITSFESWAFYNEEAAHDHQDQSEIQALEPVLQAAWKLFKSTNELSPNELKRQVEELAASMVNASSKVHQYYDPKKVTSPDKLVHAKAAQKLAEQAQGSLKKNDLAKGVQELRAGVAELAIAGLLIDQQMMKPPETANNSSSNTMKEELKKMTALMTTPPPPASATGQTQKSEKDQAKDNADQAKTAEELEKDQANLVEKLKKAAENPQQAAADKKAQEKNSGEQENIAKKAEAAAKNLKDAAGANDNKKSAAKDLADAAATMKDAAADIKKGDVNSATQKAEAAQRQIAAAKGKLQTGTQDAINNALDKAEAAAAEAARKQAGVMEKTAEAAKAKGQEKKDKAGEAAQEQAKLMNDAKALASTLEGLAKAGEAGNLKADTNKHVQTAKADMAKARIEQKIANAAVQLAAGDTAGAAAEQKKVKEALEKVSTSLQNASNARAGDLATAIKRAKAQADQVAKNAEELKKADAKDGKPDQAKGEEPAGKSEAGKAAADAKAEAAAKKDLAQKTADAAARLSRQLEARDLGKGDEQLKKDASTLAEKSKEPAKLADQLEKVPADLEELTKVTKRVQDKLEAAYQSTLKAQEIFAAQREECPPQYRQLVNNYFESLSAPAPK